MLENQHVQNHILPRPHCTFNDVWTEWLSGSKFPIAFFGDSTVDGAKTTDWVNNTLGSDNKSPNAFSARLEGHLQQAANNPNLRIYNAGFSGKVASWAVTILEEEFGEGSAYSDVKMIGIGFGINDRLHYDSEKAYRNWFKAHILQIIEWCYGKGIQPFLLTTQASVEPGVMTKFTVDYPLRTSGRINTVANEVKRELAAEYGLQLIDLNRFTEFFLLYSSVSVPQIISDRLHFGDIGHQYEAGVIFAHLCPYTIQADGYAKIDFSNQRLIDGIPEDWLTMPEQPEDRFKVYVDCQKTDDSDFRILAAWVFVHSKEPLTLTAFKNANEPAPAYVSINGEAHALTGAATVLGALDPGLYKLEAFTGKSATVDFKGFLLEPTLK